MFTLSQLDPLIQSRTLLQHPFYLAWSKGALTKEDLQVYAKEYYWLVQRVPEIVEIIAKQTNDPVLLERVQKNKEEEQEHIQLWERFAKSLDVSEVELKSYQPSATTRNAVAKMEEEAQKSLDAGIAVMYALEAELPKIAQTKKEGLLEFYGLSSADAHAYFDEHLLEEEHLKVWRSTTIDESTALAAADVSLASQHRVLDGVCEVGHITC
jgi:pyrroloquinoline-quinone synthase